jgi:uncharacterized protein with HEPN domain
MDNKKGDAYYLNKIVEDASFVVENTQGISLESFQKNILLQDSVCFRFIQISESGKKITETLKEQHTEIPWALMDGLRNHLVHDYGKIDLKVVLSTAQNDLPPLVAGIQNLLP